MAHQGSVPTSSAPANDTMAEMMTLLNVELAELYKRAYRDLDTIAGTVNAITANSTPPITAYAAGQRFMLQTTGSNTGAVTIAIDTLAAKSVVNSDGSALAGGTLVLGGRYPAEYDGTKFKLAGGGSAPGAIVDGDFSAAEGFMHKVSAGTYEAMKSNLAAIVAPGATDDSAAGYVIGSRWINTVTDKEYSCMDATATAAVWVEITAGAAGGETNTASNIGVAGVGVFKSKVGIDLQFKKLNAGSAKVTVTDDPANNEIDIDVSLVQGDVGLGNVDNTADSAKPVSTAQQTALDAKADLVSPALTGNPTAPTAAVGDNDTSIATTAFVVANTPRKGGLDSVKDEVGTTYTLVLADAGTLVRCTNAAAITLTVPTNASVAFTIGDVVDIEQGGAGAITIGGAGVTLNARGGLTTQGQFSAFALVKIATDTWLVAGTGAGVKNNFSAAVAPGVTDDSASGYTVGSSWADIAAAKAYVCLDATAGAAVWTETTAGAGGGETNTASNVGVGGIGPFKQKTGVNLEFRNIIADSTKVTVTLDGPNNEIGLDVVEANLTLANIGGTIGTAQIANLAVTFAKVQNIATARILGRNTAASGIVEELTATTAKNVLALVKADVGLSNVDDTSDAAKPVSTATQTALDAKEPLGEVTGINTQTGTTYTLVLADKGKIVEMNNAAANTLTIPPNSSVAFPVKTRIDLSQYGAGQTTVAAGAGVTIRSSGAKLKLTGQYSGAALYKRATDEWVLIGDIAA